MTKIRAVIFDFGGVLVRTVDDRPRQVLADRLGVPLSKIDSLVFYSESAQQASLGEISVDMHWDAVRKALGIQAQDLPGFFEEYWSGDEVNWELLEYIRKLNPQYQIGLLSNAWDNLRQTLHERWNIDGLFNEMIISAEVKMMKPDLRIFHLAVERLGVQPGEAVFIDDTLGNIVAAREAGLQAIRYDSYQQIVDELNGYLFQE